MTKMKILATLIALSLPIISFAASMIESRDGRGAITRIYLDGNKARIEMPGNQGYSVMDIRKRTMYVVLHPQKAVMNMTEYMQSAGSPPQSGGAYVDSFLQTKGLGPKIAGYETEEQEIYANNQYCGSVFVSVRAMNDLNLMPFAKALESMSQQIQQSITGMTGMQVNQMMDTCDQAEKNLLDQLVNIGFPLKSTNRNRQTDSVVTQLVRNTKLPANAFVIPKHYRVTTPAQMMQEAMQNMQRLPTHNQHRDYDDDHGRHNDRRYNPRHNPTPRDVINSLPHEAKEIIIDRMLDLRRH